MITLNGDPKFQVGDMVECIVGQEEKSLGRDFLVLGNIYRVEFVTSTGGIRLKGSEYLYHPSGFKLHWRSSATPVDTVNHPNHYNTGQIETIDYLRDKLTKEEFTGFCVGNVMKYLSRWRQKGGLEDLKKAQVYLGWAVENEKLSETESV